MFNLNQFLGGLGLSGSGGTSAPTSSSASSGVSFGAGGPSIQTLILVGLGGLLLLVVVVLLIKE